MNFYLKLKHQQLRDYREKHINTVLKTILLILLIWFVAEELQAIYGLLTGKSTITIENSVGVVVAEAATAPKGEPTDNLEDLSSNEGKVEKQVPSVLGIEDMIRQTFPDAPECAVAVAKCESGLEPSRIGDTHMEKYSYGLFQINQTWHPYSEETLLNPKENIRIAKEIYDSFEKRTGNGFNAWSCYKQNLYIKYL